MNKLIEDFIKYFYSKVSRCPFHVEGQVNKTHLEITLSENRVDRILAIKQACIDFYQNPEKYTAALITLPASLHQECTSIDRLENLLLPYQCEFAAAHTSAMVYPYSIYRDNSDQEWLPFSIGWELIKTCRLMGLPRPKNDFELTDLLENIIGSTVKLQGETIKFESLPLILNEDFVFNLGKVGGKVSYRENFNKEAHKKRLYLSDDKITNKNCVMFITCPFYPKAFARYSKNIVIVLTRGSDISKVSIKFAELIRNKNNRILSKYSVDVPHSQWSPKEGLWIPTYKTTK